MHITALHSRFANDAPNTRVLISQGSWIDIENTKLFAALRPPTSVRAALKCQFHSSYTAARNASLLPGLLHLPFLGFWTSASTISGFLVFCIYRFWVSGLWHLPFLDFDIYCFWVSGLLHLPFLGFWTSASTVSGFLDFGIYRFWVSGLLHLPFLGFWTSASTVSGLWRVRYHFWTLGDLPCLRNNLLRHMWRLPRT